MKKSISDKRIFRGEEISEGAKFIGNPSDLLSFYNRTPSNAFTLSLTVDESGHYKLQDIGRGYIALSSIDTISLKKIVGEDTFSVRSSIILSFAQRGGNSLHYSPTYSSSGTIKKKNNSIEISLTESSNRKQTLMEQITSSNTFYDKKPGTYKFKSQTLDLKVDIFIYDV
ncbi:hypothetical protein [Sediminibacterium soli]|uniref:hypothetical protein n=1 Tax=Sediminibacterium soli TaxID=2698829 RepID=UPI001379B327|nr:hypothetical protein [Sediminibacterium soli]NCI45262.1 hypothetical protein [Sediminibacterium soli]